MLFTILLPPDCYQDNLDPSHIVRPIGSGDMCEATYLEGRSLNFYGYTHISQKMLHDVSGAGFTALGPELTIELKDGKSRKRMKRESKNASK